MMSEPSETPIKPSYFQIETSRLEKLFESVKLRDLTAAQFEREKTERIKALAGALSFVAEVGHAGGSGSYYGSSNSDRQEIMRLLKEAADSSYKPYDWSYD